MKKFGYVIAALGAIVIAAPSIASAETVVIKRGGYTRPSPWLWRACRIPRHRDRGYHRGWRHGHRDRVVVIKKHRLLQSVLTDQRFVKTLENGSSRSHFLCCDPPVC